MSLKHGGWHHLATVRGGGALRMYVDCGVVAEAASFTAANYDLSTKVSLQIGNGQIGPFSGSLGDVRLYNRALVDTEVAAIFERSRT